MASGALNILTMFTSLEMGEHNIGLVVDITVPVVAQQQMPEYDQPLT